VVANGAYTRTQSFNPENERILPRFFIESVEDPLRSAQHGRPIFFDQERVELMIPGISQYNVKVDIVSDEHRRRWPEQYKAFKDGIEFSADGTPLEQWPILKRSQVLELKAMNFTTVEQVAQMDDQTMQRLMGGQRLRTLAKAFLDDSIATAALAKATADNERQESRIAELEAKVDQLSAMLNSVHADNQAMRDAPSPIASHIPGMHDPFEQAKQAPIVGRASSFEGLPEPRRKGRPPMPRDAAGNIVREEQHG